MSNQCRSCGRDLNNNYASYTSGYPGSSNSSSNDRQSIVTSRSQTNGIIRNIDNNSGNGSSNSRLSSATGATSSSASKSSALSAPSRHTTTSRGAANASSTSSRHNNTQITAKVMFGSVGAIKELREKEKSETTTITRAGGRRQ